MIELEDLWLKMGIQDLKLIYKRLRAVIFTFFYQHEMALNFSSFPSQKERKKGAEDTARDRILHLF